MSLPPHARAALLPYVLGGAAVLLVVAVLVLVLQLQRRFALAREQDSLYRQLSYSAELNFAEIERVHQLLRDDTRLLQTLTATGANLHAAPVLERLRGTLRDQVSRTSSLVDIVIVDADGRCLASPLPVADLVLAGPSYPRIWATARQSAAPQIFTLDPGPASHAPTPVLVVGETARSADAHLLGATLAFPSLEQLNRTFESGLGTLQRDGGQFLVTDTNGRGTTLYMPNGLEQNIPAFIAGAWRAAFLRGGGAFHAQDETGRVWIGAVVGSAVNGLGFTALKPATAVFQQLWPTELLILGGIASGLGLAAVGFLLLLRQRRATGQEAAAAVTARGQLLHTLSHDTSTGLLNQAGLVEFLQTASTATGRPVCLHIIGLDRFDLLSTTFGPAQVEQLMTQFAGRMSGVVAAQGTAARLSTGVLAVVQTAGSAEPLAKQLLRELSQPFQISGRAMVLRLSIGLAGPGDSDDWARLLRDGSIAMLRARSLPQKYCWYVPALDQPARERLYLEQEFRSALRTDQLYMVYQPIFDLRAERISGFEALMRWQHPEKGEVPPDVFIPMAESAGLLLPLEQMVTCPPLQAAAAWPASLSVAQNTPAFEFSDPNFPTRMRERLKQTGVAAGRWHIEVTESALLENDAMVLKNMAELKSLGIQLVLDDFGTGHASLSYLHRFMFDELKIDRSFIRDMATVAAADAIVETTMQLCHRLGIAVVAEGVETLEQLERLRGMGCRFVQGHLIGRPMRAERIGGFLASFRLPTG